VWNAELYSEWHALVDRLTPEERSRLMSRVRGKNTTPEVRVRKAAHALGLRFRLHRKDLPGTPDLVFPKRHVALFVHGCFWHRHPGCPKTSNSSTRPNYWADKFKTNIARDRLVIAELEASGWRAVVIWECETKNAERLTEILRDRVVKAAPLTVT
jgi:DNA mismatch endonuclease (patch repair protein)